MANRQKAIQTGVDSRMDVVDATATAAQARNLKNPVARLSGQALLKEGPAHLRQAKNHKS